MGSKMAQPVKLPTSSGLFGPVSPNGYVEIVGLAGIETGGSAAVAVVLRQGSASGIVIAALNLGISGVDTKSFNHPIKCNKQIYAQVIGAGVVDGSVHIV